MASVKDATELAARSRIYAFLAQAFSDPNAEMLAWLKHEQAATQTALTICGGKESYAASAAVFRSIEDIDAQGLAAAHRRIFGLGVSGDCPPYEGEYGHPHIFQKTQSLADAAGFLEAFGLASAPGFADRLDHISVELEFMHVLAAKAAYAHSQGHGEERLAIVQSAMRRYFAEHLGRWTPAFAAQVHATAQEGPYAAFARLLAAFVVQEARAMDIAAVPIDMRLSGQADDEGLAACEGCAQSESFMPAMRGSP